MSLVDTHTHLDAAAQAGSLPDLLRRARAAGVERLVAIGTEPADWGLYRGLAQANRGAIWYTVGLHPCSVEADWKEAVASIRGFWAGSPEDAPVALGECGLDRFHLPKDPAEAERVFGLQQAAFDAQLAIAREVGCPLVIHSRNAFGACVGAIDASGVDWTRVVFHCFSEGPAEVAELNRRRARASFTGILTYKNAEGVRAAARAQGLAALMLETDAPFLAPVPHRGQPNEPAYLRHTAEHAAALFGVPMTEIEAVTTANARAFFGL